MFLATSSCFCCGTSRIGSTRAALLHSRQLQQDTESIGQLVESSLCYCDADGGRLPRPGLAAARSISRRSVRLRAGATKTLEALREELDKNNVDAFVIPSDDPHLSEYVAPCFERRAFASGFTGSAGTAIRIEGSRIVLDGRRYWLQASQQLGEGWELVKAGAPGVDGIAAWFGTDEASEVETVGIDARVTASSFASSLEEHVQVKTPRGESRGQGLGRPAGDALVHVEAASFGVRR